MSSLRPAKILSSFVRLIGGSLFWPEEADGPTCICESCSQAWWRNQAAEPAATRERVVAGLRRVGPG
jgi:hypothetical protein